MAGDDGYPVERMQSLSEKRKEARRLKDPHHMHPFKRYFLGPTPVQSSSAALMAQAIAEDVKIDKAAAIGVLDRDGRVITGRRPSQDSLTSQTSPSAKQESSATGGLSSLRPARSLSPLRLSKGFKASSSYLDRPSFRRRVSRDASFTSAKSVAESAFSEGDLPRGSTQFDKGVLKKRSMTSDADVSYREDSLATPTKKSLAAGRVRRGESQSSHEPLRDLGRKKLSFEFLHARDRRGRSEGSPIPGHSILQKDNHGLETPSRRMTHLTVNEEDSFTLGDTPTSARHRQTLHPLRPTASHRSLGNVSFTGLPATPTSQMRAEAPLTPHAKVSDPPSTPHAKVSDPPISILTDADTSLGFDTSTSARLQRLRDRARKRYGQGAIGKGSFMLPHTSTQQSGIVHGRDVSRQSRMSRASTAGTFASIGTRFTDGSFGATGGVRAKLVKKLGGKSSKSLLNRARDIKLEHSRHGRSVSIKGGVMPGTVGTSAGGTRWVGQSFEVGKRFWEVLELREEELHGDTIDEEALQEEQLDQADERKNEADAIRRAVDAQHKRQASLNRDPDQVLDSFARDASRAVNNAASLADDKGVEHTSKRPVIDLSIDSKSHKRESSNGEIESRKGWSDVLSMVTAKSSLSKIGDEGKSVRSRLNNVRAKQEEERVRQQDKGDGSSDNPKDKDKRRPTAMTAKEALSHPEPPLGAEERFPQATHELLRRTSHPGVRVGHEHDDAASDFEVSARPVSQSPQLLTPSTPSPPFRWDGSSTLRNRTNSTASLDGKAMPRLQNTVPLLRKRASAIGIVVDGVDLESSQDRSTKMSNKHSILRDAGFDESNHKKTVQFQGSNNLTPPLTRTFGSNMFLRSTPTKELDGLTLMAGRTKRVVKGDDAPAPPEEVLSRNASPSELTPPPTHTLAASPSASVKAEELVTIRSVLRRDRMLVRLAWTPSENLPKDFSERDSRKYPIYSEPFKEYMVVYRTGRLELWEDPSLMSRCLGHGDQLNLSAAVSLKRGRAFVSTYSYIDRIFCLTFVKDDDSHHRLLHLRKSGTCIWFFDARSITVGADWMWELWRELGGVIPQQLDVHIPAFSVRVRVPVPDEVSPQDATSTLSKASSYIEAGEGFKMLTPKYVKQVVREVIRFQPEWSQLCHVVEMTGMQFELAWRSGPTLNWVKEHRTADGQRRDWCVLVGSIVSEPQRPSVLEYRPAFHYPTSVRMPKGETMQEPPGIEGFMWRVKAVSGALTRLYTTTHDGLIFINRSAKAFPPDRHLAAAAADAGSHNINKQTTFALSATNDQIEQDRRRKRDAIRGRKRSANRDESLAELRKDVVSALVTPPTTEEEIDGQIEAYRAFEKRRQFEQIANCDGYVDMRDIIAVRSMDEEDKARSDGAERANGHIGGVANGSVKVEKEEEEDIGGEEGLALAADRVAMKKSRQFEVVLSNGRSVRFEVYSRSVAKEWVERLTELSTYWKRREKVDALELMTASGISPTLIGKQKGHGQREARTMDESTEGERLSSVLGNLWHWCVHQSCRGIIRSGRLFQKKKAFSGFYSRYYILIAGRLIHFKLMTSTSTARARQNSGIFHRRQETVVHLRDAYVYSGQLTEDMLVNGRSEGASSINTYGSGTSGAANANSRHLLPRVYRDGLMSFDDDEDCTLVVRYRPQRVNQAADPTVKVGSSTSMVESTTTPASASSIPKLGDAIYNHLVLRARCKLERDLWVRAINTECERLNRMDQEREAKIRNQGETPWKSHWHR